MSCTRVGCSRSIFKDISQSGASIIESWPGASRISAAMIRSRRILFSFYYFPFYSTHVERLKELQWTSSWVNWQCFVLSFICSPEILVVVVVDGLYLVFQGG
ncbi:hypothetical protein BDV26DRAFT_276881 [Aspergillus bertholletiae]|uniref:Uncharacterized protein n=1 Tax=Aspergillus bertholletiae TaxID=1226010 RepID=A0A5N7AQK7_9EURO|nr:hypothetical protein BDV26DRAFT_276881 [Aspergillus bertholletiae]